MIIGYTADVSDLFYVSHLNLLRNTRAMCDRLLAGVIDELVNATFPTRCSTEARWGFLCCWITGLAVSFCWLPEIVSMIPTQSSVPLL